MRPTIWLAILAAVAIAAALAWRYGLGRLDGVVASTVERYGSAVTGTSVDVDSVELALTAGRAVIGGIRVGNPRGYQTEYAVRIGTATVELDIGSLSGDVPVVEELLLDGTLINAEQREVASNLTDIQEHVTSSSGEAPAGDPARIIVERFRVRNARVLVTSEHLSKPEELQLSDVVVTGIGTAAGGVTYSEAATAMLMPVIAAARSAAADRLRRAAGDAVSEAAREELEEESAELRQRTEEAREELGDKVERLLERE